jgi:hypothetical protein
VIILLSNHEQFILGLRNIYGDMDERSECLLRTLSCQKNELKGVLNYREANEKYIWIDF